MIHHMRLDIKGALRNWRTPMFKKLFQDDSGRTLSAQEAKDTLLLELSKGHHYFPIGYCDGFDPVEKGCPGHSEVAGNPGEAGR